MKIRFYNEPSNLMLTTITQNPHLIPKLIQLVGEGWGANHFVSRGTIFWHTLESYDGWRLQRHLFMDSCRVLDARGKCVVIGKEAAVLGALKILYETFGDAHPAMVDRYRVCESLAERMVSDEELAHMKLKSLIIE